MIKCALWGGGKLAQYILANSLSSLSEYLYIVMVCDHRQLDDFLADLHCTIEKSDIGVKPTINSVDYNESVFQLSGNYIKYVKLNSINSLRNATTIADIREFSDRGADMVIDCSGMNMTSEIENAFYVNNVKMLFQIANQDTASSIETIFNSMAIGTWNDALKGYKAWANTPGSPKSAIIPTGEWLAKTLALEIVSDHINGQTWGSSTLSRECSIQVFNYAPRHRKLLDSSNVSDIDYSAPRKLDLHLNKIINTDYHSFNSDAVPQVNVIEYNVNSSDFTNNYNILLLNIKLDTTLDTREDINLSAKDFTVNYLKEYGVSYSEDHNLEVSKNLLYSDDYSLSLSFLAPSTQVYAYTSSISIARIAIAYSPEKLFLRNLCCIAEGLNS